MSIQELKEKIVLQLENFDFQKLTYIDSVINKIDDSNESSFLKHAKQVIEERSEVLAKLAQ